MGVLPFTRTEEEANGLRLSSFLSGVCLRSKAVLSLSVEVLENHQKGLKSHSKVDLRGEGLLYIAREREREREIIRS